METKRQIIEDIFGTSNFHEVMRSLSQIDPAELKIKCINLRHQRNRLNKNDLGEKMKTHDGTVEPLEIDLRSDDWQPSHFRFQSSHKKNK